jgi:ribosomal protein S4
MDSIYPTTLLNRKKKVVCFKKKLNLLKKQTDFKKLVLFSMGTRYWKQTVFRRPEFRANNFSDLSIYDAEMGNNTKKYQYSKIADDQLYNKNLTKQKNMQFNTKSRFGRVFYHNRKFFGSFMGRDGLRQHRFTTLYNSFFKKNWLKLLNNFEFNLVDMLIKCRFAFTKTYANSLIDDGYVFINGVMESDNSRIIKKGDFIQLIITNDLFINSRRELSDTYYLKKFLGYRVWRVTRFLFNKHKQSSKHIPD